jgi:hypothetical protein
LTNAVNEAEAATLALTQAIADAEGAKDDLSVASKVAVVGVVSNRKTICAAANSCTRAELLSLQEKVAVASLLVVEATQAVIVKAQNLQALVEALDSNFDVSTVKSLLDAAAVLIDLQKAMGWPGTSWRLGRLARRGSQRRLSGWPFCSTAPADTWSTTRHARGRSASAPGSWRVAATPRPS